MNLTRLACGVSMLAGWLALADTVGPNVNTIGNTPPVESDSPLNDTDGFNLLVPDVGLKQQNEPWCGRKPDNPLHVICFFNDYRLAEDPIRGGDAWQGVAMSRDGGITWLSRLAPGFKGYRPDEGLSLNLAFAGDPTGAAVPGMVLFNFIAKNRSIDNDGGIYLQRWWETQRESGFPWEPDPVTIEIERGTPGQFIDKPTFWFLPGDPDDSEVSVGGLLEDGTLIQRSLPAGTALSAYTIFTGNENNNGTKLVVRTSPDYGETWSQAFFVAESVEVNQGASLIGDPVSDALVIVWRRFSDPLDPNAEAVDAIMYSLSTDGGRKWSKAKTVADIACPFDHPSTKVTFRANGFPVVTHDGDKFLAFWTQRENLAGGSCDDGDPGRVVMSTFAGQGQWSDPVQVEPSDAGHQLMPAVSSANGEVQLAWIDTSEDEVVEQVASVAPGGILIDIESQPQLDLVKDLLNIDAASTGPVLVTGEQLRDARFIFDFRSFVATGPDTGAVALFRHTADVRAVKIVGQVPQLPSDKVTRFKRGTFRDVNGNPVLDDDGLPLITQIERFYLNTKMFKKGAYPFNGDYIAVAAPQFRLTDNVWESNVPASIDVPAQRFFIAWGDPRDARGNMWIGDDADGDGVESTQYANPGAGPLDAPDDPIACDAANPPPQSNRLDLSRNMNVYGAMISPDFGLSSPSASKPVLLADGSTVQRSFVLSLRNSNPASDPSDPGRTFQLEILDPGADVDASFDQFAAIGVVQIEVNVAPESTAARTVFVSSSTEVSPAVTVRARENGALLAEIVLNANPIAPELENIDQLLTQEIHDPVLLTLDGAVIIDSSGQITNPTFINFELANPTFLNPTYLNPTFLNPTYINPTFLNPTFLNPTYLNPTFINPTFLNPTFLNPTYINNQLENPTFINSPPGAETDQVVSDVTVYVTNDGNTTTAYNLSPFVNANLENVPTQLIASRLYATPSSDGCLGSAQIQNHTLFNINNPRLDSDSDLDVVGDAGAGVGSLFVQPGETVAVTLRVWNDPDFDPSSFGFRAYSQACNTGQTQGCATPQDGFGELDQTPPELTPEGGTFLGGFEANEPGGVTLQVSDLVTATDQPSGVNVDVECAAGTIAPDPAVGVGTVFLPVDTFDLACAAADAVGNTTTAQYSVSVLDTIAPTFDTVPSSFALEATSGSGAVANFVAPTASDVVDTDPAVSCDAVSGSTFPLGTTLVTCSAVDDSGNTAVVSFDITVQDTSAPQLSVPSNVVAEATSPDGKTVSYGLPTAVDAVDGAPVVACVPASGSVFGLGTTTVACTASDSSGNVASVVFDVTVEDTTGPSIAVPDDVELVPDASGSATYAFDVTVADLADANPVVACTPADFVGRDGDLYTFSGTFNGATVIQCSASDAGGNSTNASFTINVSLVFIGLHTPDGTVAEGEIGPKIHKGGSTVPLTWQYGDGSDLIDSADFAPMVYISGPYDQCALVPTVLDTSAEDPGSSDTRYKASSLIWQFDWQTPKLPGPKKCWGVFIQTDAGQVNGPFNFEVR